MEGAHASATPALRTIAVAEGVVIAASQGGKEKAALQMVAVLFLVLHHTYDLDFLFMTAHANLHAVGLALLYGSVFFAITSAGEYVKLFADAVEKVALRANSDRWKAAFAYVASRPELEDIVISGGDAYQLRPEWVREIGHTLLNMPNILRIRFATKGPAIMPQKMLTHH